MANSESFVRCEGFRRAVNDRYTSYGRPYGHSDTGRCSLYQVGAISRLMLVSFRLSRCPQLVWYGRSPVSSLRLMRSATAGRGPHLRDELFAILVELVVARFGRHHHVGIGELLCVVGHKGARGVAARVVRCVVSVFDRFAPEAAKAACRKRRDALLIFALSLPNVSTAA